MIKQQLVAGAALLVGVAIGYFMDARGKHASVDEAAAPKAAHAAKRPTDLGVEASNAALRKRVAELEKALAAARNASGVVVTNVVAQPPMSNGARPERPPFRERLEELKKNDPARYAQITNRMAQFRARHQARQEAKQAFLASVDPSVFDAAGKKTHARLQALTARAAEIDEALHDENLTDENRHALMDEMRKNERALRELNRTERSNLLNATVTSLGFSGNDAQDITATLQDIITSTEGGGHGGPPGGQPPPPPGGGR